MCEPRRRRLDRGERGVEIAYQAFLAFYRTMNGSSRPKTTQDFETSPYYRAFVKFGRYCVGSRVIDPESYMNWLLKTNRKIDRWALDTEYTEFLTEWLPAEPVLQALARARSWAQDWADTATSVPQHCLRYGNVNSVCHAIVSGRITGWVLYNCNSGQDFLSRLHFGDVDMIWPYINADRWSQRFRDSPADQAMAQSTLAQEGW